MVEFTKGESDTYSRAKELESQGYLVNMIARCEDEKYLIVYRKGDRNEKDC